MADLNDKMMKSPDLNKERLEKLKELFPDLFTPEGELKVRELEKAVNPEDVPESERFEFKWFGKSDAKRKAFTPSKGTLLYDESRSVNPEHADGNMIIEGENLETMKVLLSAYREKIKCIYIDPPYNTGNDFVYSDTWDEEKQSYWEHIGVTEQGVKVDTNTDASGRYHSNWLNMMYPRLLLARQLLREDGVIFISIDDNEVHHLRKMCDEVFGEENFIADVIWEKKYTRSNDARWFSDNHDFLLVYAKNKELVKLNKLPRSEKQLSAYKNPDNHPKGKWKATPLHAKSGSNTSFNYEFSNGVKWSPPQGTYPRFSKKTLAELDANNEVWFGKDGKAIPQKKTFLSETNKGLVPITIWKYKEVGHTHEANNELKEIELSGAFDNPKPTRLLKQVVRLVTDPDEIILDFFAGSGTTAHAVMDLNKEDGENRKFILIQLPEQTSEDSEAYKAGYKTISDICIERNKRVIDQIQEEYEEDHSLFKEGKPELGFKVYNLAKSNFPRVDFQPDPDKTEEENIELLKEYIDQKEAALDSLFNKEDIFDEVLLKNGFMLNYTLEKQEQFTNNKVFIAADKNKQALICLDLEIKDETIATLKEFTDQTFICLEQSLDTTKKWNLSHILGEKLIAV